MSWVKENLTLLTEWPDLDKSDLCVKNNELFAATCVGFFFLLRVSEIEGLRMKDVRIIHEDGESFLTISIDGGGRSIQPMGFQTIGRSRR